MLSTLIVNNLYVSAIKYDRYLYTRICTLAVSKESINFIDINFHLCYTLLITCFPTFLVYIAYQKYTKADKGKPMNVVDCVLWFLINWPFTHILVLTQLYLDRSAHWKKCLITILKFFFFINNAKVYVNSWFWFCM